MPWCQHQLVNQEETPFPPRTPPRRLKTETTDPSTIPAKKRVYSGDLKSDHLKSVLFKVGLQMVRILNGI